MLSNSSYSSSIPVNTLFLLQVSLRKFYEALSELQTYYSVSELSNEGEIKLYHMIAMCVCLMLLHDSHV